MKESESKRLADLLAAYPCMSTATENVIESVAEDLATYLIDNGVFAPPVCVGQTVYMIGQFTGQIVPSRVVFIARGKDDLYLVLDSHATVHCNVQLGEVVFLTREEAEEKLAKMKEEKG